MPACGGGDDADAGVLHHDFHGDAAVAARQRETCTQHLAALGELDGVAHQVGQHLAQPQRIAAHAGQRGVVLRIVGHQFHALALGGVREHGQHFLHQRRQVQVHCLQFHLSGLDLRVVEDVVERRSAGAVRNPARPAPIRVCRASSWLLQQQQFVHAQHAVERRADFMAHGGQEHALGAAGRLGLLPWRRAVPRCGAPPPARCRRAPLRSPSSAPVVASSRRFVPCTSTPISSLRCRAGSRSRWSVPGCMASS